MLKKVTQILSGGSIKAESYINTDAILWLEDSRADEVGETHVLLMGKGEAAPKVSITMSLKDALSYFDLGTVQLQQRDSCRRPQFQNMLEVVRENIRLVRPVLDFYQIEFVDGSCLDVMGIDGLV